MTGTGLLPPRSGTPNRALAGLVQITDEYGTVSWQPAGQFTTAIAPAAVALTYGSTVTADASQGNVFTLTLTGSSATIANPASGKDGQVIRFRVTQDATGSRTLSWGAAFDWGSTSGSPNSAPTLSTTAAVTDVLGFEYDAAASKWLYLGAPFPQGF